MRTRSIATAFAGALFAVLPDAHGAEPSEELAVLQAQIAAAGRTIGGVLPEKDMGKYLAKGMRFLKAPQWRVPSQPGLPICDEDL